MAILRSGSSVSRYRVVSPIGAGGMGEVYKALDESLERSIALKILPPELTRNDERVRRFIQEAKSASSLSHPHIVSIYEIGQADIEDEGATHPVHYIAMELVDGHTLKNEIHEQRTELRTLLIYLSQVADALAKAHSAGIIHRDLKPENVMISRDGYAKVLDFGLAKLTEKHGSGDGQTNAPTAVREKTREGTVMGTVGYMSPEQVQGKSVDHRSDIFSFGALLYEAATRQRAFDADSDVDIMHKILHDKPQPVDEINPAVPAEVRRMIKRCMAKDPERRYQSMKDISIELGDIVEEWDVLSATSSGSTSFPSGAAAVPPARRTRAIMFGLGAAALIAIAAVVYLLTRSPADSTSPPAPALNVSRLTGSGTAVDAAISPDGKYVSYVVYEGGKYSVRVRQVSTASEVQIVDPEQAPIGGLTFSGNGDYIYYIRNESTGAGYSNLFQVPALGGTPRKLLFDIDTEPNFSPDQKQFTFVRGYPQFGESALMIANADGSNDRKLATVKSPSRFPSEGPAWSPDGKIIATALESDEGGFHERPVIIDVATGKRSDLGAKRFEDLAKMVWLPDGSGLLCVATDSPSATNRQIWLLSYPGGEARRITSDLSDYFTLSVTADGKTIAASQSNWSSNLWIVPPGKAPRRVTTGTGLRVLDLRAKKKRIYFTGLSDQINIWSANPDGSDLRPLLNDQQSNWGPDLPDDESFVAFVSLREGRVPHIFRANPDGTGLKRITTTPTRGTNPDLSPDGSELIFLSASGAHLMKMGLNGGTAVPIADRVVGGGSFSPDGTKIAYGGWLKLENGREEPRSVIIARSGGAPLTTLPGGRQAEWAPDSMARDFVMDNDGADNLWRMPFTGADPKKITNFDSGIIITFAWAPDGTLYLGKGDIASDIVLINGFAKQ